MTWDYRLTFSVISSSTGAIIKTFRGNNGNDFYKFHRMNQMIVDASDNLYIGFQEMSASNYVWTVQKFSPLGSNPTSSPFYIRMKDIDST